MTAWPDARVVAAFLARASRRIALLAAAQGAAAGLAVAIVLVLIGWPRSVALTPALGIAILLMVLGATICVVVARRRREPVSHVVERRAPQCRNVVITADELIAPRNAQTVAQPASEYVARLVCRDAARVVGTLDPSSLFPSRNPLLSLASCAALWAIAVGFRASPVSVTARRILGRPAAGASVNGIEFTITPPGYSGQKTSVVRDPERIEALVGSKVHVAVRADAQSVTLETLRGRTALASSGGDSFTGDVAADADGFIAIEPKASDGHAGARRLIGLSVVPDHVPRVRIVTPGQDVFFKDASHTIDVAIEASDDIGLASLKLRYTKVSGSGERFSFSEGEVPIAVARTNARAWTARVQWKLDPLALTPGDMVVYRAVAADHRPGATPVESDSYIAEMLAPGGDAAAGFALDPDQERYAVSQQMVILKTERLAAKRATMTPEAFLTGAQEIAVEQRKVRAEFVFMMGGELADAPDPTGNINDLNEAAEAEGESDLAAGRMANQGRIALLRAIRSMSRASTSLTTADVAPALTEEREALRQLEQAFSRTRIILRALTQREALDLTRRLSGTLTDAARDVHPSADPHPDPRVVALRQSLSAIATLAANPSREAASELSNLAQRVLQVDASSKPLQDVSSLLANAATASGAGRTTEAKAQLDRAATALASALRGDVLAAPSRAAPPALSGLNGALTDALRHQRGVP